MLKLPEAKNALALTTFEAHPPLTGNPRAAQFIDGFRERAAKAALPSTSVDLLSTIAYASWQVLEAAVTGAKSFDDKALAQWLRQSQVDTVMGRLSWQGTPDGPPNFVMGKDIYKVKQLQDGKWLVVWPREFAAPGAKLTGP
jgi:branched-chain amino acid transport system substrate-binding protein